MGLRLSRRSLLKAAARLGAGAGLALLGLGKGAGQTQDIVEDEGPYFHDSGSKLTLGNRYYEVDFDRRNGAITRIFDKRGGGVVSEGNADGSLWALATGAWPVSWHDGWPWQYFHARQQSITRFDWSWDDSQDTLSFDYEANLHYEPSLPSGRLLLHVDIAIADAPYLDLTARIDNQSNERIDWLDFPDRLAFRSNSVEQAMLPYFGGVLVGGASFQKGDAYFAERYPHVAAMGDLVHVETKGGAITIYALHGESEYWKSVLGFGHNKSGQPPTSYWRHAFALALRPNANAQLPTMRLRLGSTPVQAAAHYRTDNDIDQYPDLKAKVGDYYEAARRSPTITTYASGREWPSIYSYVDSPALLHPVVPQKEGGNYANSNPDWWPPVEAHGGEQAYLSAFAEAQRDGKLVMPFTSLNAVNEQSDTARDLEAQGLTVFDISARSPSDAMLRFEFSYPTAEGDVVPWENDPVAIVRPSPSSTRYLARLDKIMADLEAADSDFVFEDGFDNWYYDEHPDANSPLRYAHSWLAHAEKYTGRNLTGEGMSDRMVEHMVGGYYNIMWTEDLNGIPWSTGDWSYFPAAAVMFRDRALLWTHNFANFSDWRWSNGQNTWSSIDLFRWHLAVGQLFAIGMPANLYADPWLPVVTAFSHHVMGPFADEILIDFQGDTKSVSTSVFETTTVVANWTERPYSIGDHVLVPGGVVVQSHDGALTGGAFQSYNSKRLSTGEHYLIEQRKSNGVILRQPMGPDTFITVPALESFGTTVQVTAFNRQHESISSDLVELRDGNVRINYQRLAAPAVEYSNFEASIELGATNREDGVREVVMHDNRSQAVERDGRQGRRPPWLDWGDRHDPLIFSVERSGIPETGTDITLAVEFFDNHQAGEYLGVVYDGVYSEDEQFWEGPLNGDRTWRTYTYFLPEAAFRGRQWGELRADFTVWIPEGVTIGKITVVERRAVAYYTIHDPTQGETLSQGLHLRGWTDATQPIVDIDLDGLQAIYAWDAEAASWLLYSPDVPARFNTLDTLEQGRAYYVRVRNGHTLHWPDAPYGGVGFHLQPGRNLVCWLGTPDKSLTDAIAPLRGMKAEPLVSVTLDERTYDVEESRSATEPLSYGQALWVEIDAVGPTRWLQF